MNKKTRPIGVALISKRDGKWRCSWKYLIGTKMFPNLSKHRSLDLAKKKAKNLGLSFRLSNKVYLVQ